MKHQGEIAGYQLPVQILPHTTAYYRILPYTTVYTLSLQEEGEHRCDGCIRSRRTLGSREDRKAPHVPDCSSMLARMAAQDTSQSAGAMALVVQHPTAQRSRGSPVLHQCSTTPVDWWKAGHFHLFWAL